MKKQSFIKGPARLLFLLLGVGWAVPGQAALPGEYPPARHVYVDSAYTSSDSGWGITRFQTVEDAAPFAPGTAVHLAAGMDAAINGSLELDGCFFDCISSNGTFSITVNSEAALRMERTSVSGCSGFTVHSSDTEIQSCYFSGTPLQISAMAEDVHFFHNVLAAGAVLTDEGAGTVTSVDGWSNPGSFSNTWNRMSLEWIPDGLPAGRTLNENGLFIQPGDAAGLSLNLADLSAPIAGCEVLVACDANLLANQTLTLSEPWSFNLAEVRSNGTLNAAIGLGLSAPKEGVTEDGTVAELTFQALEAEGRSVVSFRPEEGLWDTRLASDPDGQSGVYLTPLTLNSSTMTIDGTAPALQPLRVMQDDSDLTAVEAFASAGTVEVTLDAVDALAGIAGAALSVSLADDGSTILVPGAAADSAAEQTRRFVWPVEITAQTASGTYIAEAVAIDRSGNVATNLASFTVGRPPLSLTVAMQGAISSAYNFDVVIQALDASGNELKSWTVYSSFLFAQTAIEVDGVPDDVAFLTADTAVTLRRRLPVSFSDGQWSFDGFSGENALLGGDLNGDLTINSFDYLVLRQNFQGSGQTADINRDGAVNSLDYLIMRRNWQKIGE